jgi:hypothetical protein
MSELAEAELTEDVSGGCVVQLRSTYTTSVREAGPSPTAEHEMQLPRVSQAEQEADVTCIQCCTAGWLSPVGKTQDQVRRGMKTKTPPTDIRKEM